MRSTLAATLFLGLFILWPLQSIAVNDSDAFDKVEFAIPQGEARHVESELVIRLDNTYYRLPYYLQTEEDRKNFDPLSEKMKTKFLMNRDAFFQNAAKVLHALDWAMGFGSVAKEKILFFRKSESPPPAIFKERKTAIVQSILTSMNTQLWHEAPIVAEANEFALFASVGIGIEGGSFQKGWGGQFELGISLGFNKEQKAFVFQIFRNVEKFKSTVMPGMIYAGIVGKAGLQVVQNGTGGIETRAGSTFYPPAAPGFLTETPTMFSSGVSSGIGFPPPPLGDLLTFTNEIDHKAILRVVVSPTLKGFVRVYIGLDRKTIGFLLTSIPRFAHSIRERFQVRMCNRVY